MWTSSTDNQRLFSKPGTPPVSPPVADRLLTPLIDGDKVEQSGMFVGRCLQLHRARPNARDTVNIMMDL